MAGEGSPPKELAYPIRAVTESMSFLSYFGEGCDRFLEGRFCNPRKWTNVHFKRKFHFPAFFFQGICQFSGEYIFYRLFGVLIP